MSDQLRDESIDAFEARRDHFGVGGQQLHVMQNELYRALLRNGHERTQRGELLVEGGSFGEQHLHEASEVAGEGQRV